MPTSGYNFTAQQITVRFRAPYISESLNQQFRGIVSAGVYEGFNPATSATPMHITLATDLSGRSSALAVSDLDPTTSVGVHLVGDLDLDLSAYFSKTVAVCIDLSYAFPADTTGVVNVYDLGTETVPATSCVLAKVIVPAAGVIPAANISCDSRSFPYLSRGRDATPMVSVVRNGAPYLTHNLVGVPDFWDSASLVGMTYIASNAVLAPSGFNLTFRARKNVAGLGSVSGVLRQKIGLPIPANRRLRLTVAFRPTVVPSVGNPVLSATITDAAGVTITTATLQLDSAVVGVWETYSTTVQLPAVTTTAAVVKEVFVQCSGVSYTTVGVNAPIFDIADVDLQLEQHGPATDAIPEISGESHFTKTRHYADAFPGAAFSQITFNGTTTLLDSSIAPAAHEISLVGALTQYGGGFALNGGTVNSGLSTTTGQISIITFGTGNILLETIGAGNISLFTGAGGNLALRATGAGSAIVSSTFGTSIFAGGAGPAVVANTLQLGAVDDIAITTSGASGIVQIVAAGGSGDVILSAGRNASLTAAGTGIVTIGSASGQVAIGSLSGNVAVATFVGGVSIFVGGPAPAPAAGDVLIGTLVNAGGISLFAGGSPPTPNTNDLRLGAVGSTLVTSNSIDAVGVVRGSGASTVVWASPASIIRKADSLPSVSSSETFVDDSTLTKTIPAGKYKVTAMLFYVSGAAPIKTVLRCSSNFDGRFAIRSWTLGVGLDAEVVVVFGAVVTSDVVSPPTALLGGFIEYIGTIDLASESTLKVQYAQNASSATPTSVGSGSFLEFVKLEF